MISAVFITFKKSFAPHKLRLYLTPKAFFFDAFQKLLSGNTGQTHTVTHTTNCGKEPKSTGEETVSFPVLCLPVGLIESVP